MREFELIIDDALKNGLSPYDAPFNSQLLYQCYGFKCGKIGLEPYTHLTNPLPGTIDMYYSWPFPQFIAGEKYNVLVIRDTVNQEDDVYVLSDDHATITYVFSVDELTFGKGTLMEVADFGKYIFMVNGVIMIYYDPTLVAWQALTEQVTIPLMRTVCNLNGQAVGGGITSTWHGCDETFYAWSKIGSLDFTPDQDNEAGFRRCPFGGSVLNVRKLGNGAVGYSSKGITLLDPVKEPAFTFGFAELLDVGIINQGAINGNDKRHVFVGEDYILREITNQGVKEIGYKRYMEELEDEDIIVSYDPAEKDFYIGNSLKTFLLSTKGLTEIDQHPSSVWRREKSTYMIPATIDSELPYICTEPFDMGYKGQKTTFVIETDAMPVDEPEAGVDYANDLTLWNDENYQPINDMGIATNIVSGNFFRFRLRFNEIYGTTRIGYLKVRYKMTDMRGIRGVQAPGIRGQNRGE